MKFDWNGFKPAVKARVFGQVFTKLAKDHNNEVKPKMIVDAARSPSSPLHSAFEWNDRKAAEHYRVEQARKMIAALVIITDDGERNKRVIIGVPVEKDSKGKRYYGWTADIMKDPEKRQRVLDIALMELDHFQQKYQHLVQLAEVFSAIDRVKTRVNRKNKKLQKAVAA